ncbi:MAG TPA: hypothetical protein VGI67_08495 [Thermoleophilaceae bacterium]|jgi:hypothetical protein
MAATLRSKLQLKGGDSLELRGAPDGLDLSELAEGDTVVGALAFVSASADVPGQLAALTNAAAEPSGLAWGAYPKKSSGIETDVTRDHGWDALYEAGLQPVRQIAIDDTWSALRFRRAEHVG